MLRAQNGFDLNGFDLTDLALQKKTKVLMLLNLFWSKNSNFEKHSMFLGIKQSLVLVVVLSLKSTGK